MEEVAFAVVVVAKEGAKVKSVKYIFFLFLILFIFALFLRCLIFVVAGNM
jgi:hypothetical protein